VSESIAREAEIATSNPLLNLQAALGQTPGGSSTSSSFTVKRQWDDGNTFSIYFYFQIINSFSSFLVDLIFKNQASTENKPTHFVNDLLRTEFHKYDCLFVSMRHN
jgi:protein CWC15